MPREEFVAVWDEARRRETEPGADAYAAAVAQTCRWLAAVPMRTALCGGLPRSPVTQRACVARAELIEAEKRYWDERHPEQNSLRRSISHAKIERLGESPRLRANMGEAVAAFPRVGRERSREGAE